MRTAKKRVYTEEQRERANAAARAYYHANKEKAQEKTRRWRENHPEWEKEYRRKRAEKRRAQLIAEGKLKPKPPKMPLSVNNILAYFKTPESRASVLWLLQHKKKSKQ